MKRALTDTVMAGLQQALRSKPGAKWAHKSDENISCVPEAAYHHKQ